VIGRKNGETSVNLAQKYPAAAAKASEFDARLHRMMGQFGVYLTEGTSKSWWDGFMAEGREFGAVGDPDTQQFIDTISARCSRFYME
jgi:hypothetical protein